MAEHSRSYFTRRVAFLGLVIGAFIALDAGGSSDYYNYLPTSGYKYFLYHFLRIKTTSPFEYAGGMHTYYLPWGSAISATVCGGIGCFILWISSRLDSPDVGDKLWESNYILSGIWAGGVGFIFVAIMMWRTDLYGDSGASILSFLLVLPMIPLAMIGTVVVFVYVGLWLGIFFGGLICVPRILYVMTRTHQLQKAWQRGKYQVTFHAPDVALALGVPAESVTVARKLRKDAAALKAEVQAAAEVVKRQEAEIAKSMTDDAERFRLEAETSKLMAEIEERKIRIEELKRLKREDRNAKW